MAVGVKVADQGCCFDAAVLPHATMSKRRASRKRPYSFAILATTCDIQAF